MTQAELTPQHQTTLEQLAWGLEMGAAEAEFSLLFAYCNSTALRQQLIQKLREICSIPIQEIVLKPETTQLLTAIQTELGEQSPQALMVTGFEHAQNLEQLLVTANRVREEFRKQFPFPIVFWVSDRIQNQFFTIARDLESWASGTTLEFQVSTSESAAIIQQAIDDVFDRSLAAGGGPFIKLSQQLNLTPQWMAELTKVWEALEQSQAQIDLPLEAGWEFLQGRATRGLSEPGRQHYERSWQLWQQKLDSSPQPQDWICAGCVLIHLGVWWRGFTERNRYKADYTEAAHYFEQGIQAFDQANRPDIVARYINRLGEMLHRLKRWSALETLANRAISLHQTYPDPIWLAHDRGMLQAEIAIAKQDWQQVQHLATTALETLANAETTLQQPLCDQVKTNLAWARANHRGWYLLSLGRAQWHLGLFQTAIATLEQARSVNNPAYNPYLYLRILRELRTFYYEQKQYLNAFQVKKDQQLIEYQYRFRAFLGAARISIQQSKPDEVLTEEKKNAIVAQEIAASGRSQNIEELLQRIQRKDHKLTVICGASGVGKSSLLQTGLIPALRQKPIETRKVLPVLQRVYTNWPEQLSNSITRAFDYLDLASLAPQCWGESVPQHSTEGSANHFTEQTSGGQNPPGLGILENQNPILHQLQQNTNNNLLTVIIFDQFEEFFFEYDQPPQRKIFYQFLKACLNIPAVKVVLSLREDYLHYLLECNDRLVSLDIVNNDILGKNTLYYLGDFSKAQAKQVIQRLTAQAQYSLQPELIDALVDDLAAERGTVLPIELQVVGAQLQAEKITYLEKYQQRGDKAQLVERYLEDVVKDCGAEHWETVWKVLVILTNEKGTRPLRTESEVASASQLPVSQHQLILKVLVESGLVFHIQNSPEDYYQLVHDYLVTPIRIKYEEVRSR
ncbi:MAG: hypothetical protein HC835_19955 [Oscillatoriales cyanobacterium RM2_1_1]|nr:hypothetical protein [Oscillatoriales cyanobacterium SM2_3_0]NJO47685.1 hypothetical protein [Oscillatoriales cyanobacterium RM2_1_1]